MLSQFPLSLAHEPCFAVFACFAVFPLEPQSMQWFHAQNPMCLLCRHADESCSAVLSAHALQKSSFCSGLKLEDPGLCSCVSAGFLKTYVLE